MRMSRKIELLHILEQKVSSLCPPGARLKPIWREQEMRLIFPPLTEMLKTLPEVLTILSRWGIIDKPLLF